MVREGQSATSLNGSCSGHSSVRRSKGMKGAPKSICYVSIVRNMGLPKGRESYGNGVLIVVVEVTPHQGDGRADYRAKQDRKASFL